MSDEVNRLQKQAGNLMTWLWRYRESVCSWTRNESIFPLEFPVTKTHMTHGPKWKQSKVKGEPPSLVQKCMQEIFYWAWMLHTPSRRPTEVKEAVQKTFCPSFKTPLLAEKRHSASCREEGCCEKNIPLHQLLICWAASWGGIIYSLSQGGWIRKTKIGHSCSETPSAIVRKGSPALTD